MFRIWGKLISNNHLLKDHVAVINDDDTRTHKVLRALEEICVEFDLEQPIWLDSNIREFQKLDKTRFTRDSFIEAIDFDYLEFMVIEE